VVKRDKVAIVSAVGILTAGALLLLGDTLAMHVSGAIMIIVGIGMLLK
jgi:hypothetical protein